LRQSFPFYFPSVHILARISARGYYPIMAAKTGLTSTERRSNVELRTVIDEMLERIRDYRRLIGAWTPEERAQAERELEMIMARIRRAASRQE
jgi:hypothetical protein